MNPVLYKYKILLLFIIVTFIHFAHLGYFLILNYGSGCKYTIKRFKRESNKLSNHFVQNIKSRKHQCGYVHKKVS